MMNYLKFNGEDFDFSFCTWVPKHEPGFELVYSLDVRHNKDRFEILKLMKEKGIVAAYDEWSGYIRIFPWRLI